MSHFTAVLDACVLYSAMLRNVFMYLAATDLFRAKWTAEIHDEWMRNVCKKNPGLKRSAVETIRDLMDTHVGDALVTGHVDLVDSLSLPDPTDAHVLAAAICAKASVIVTFNLKDFPAAELAKYGIEAQHPDEFVRHLLDLSPSTVVGALDGMRLSLRKPPYTEVELINRLEQVGLIETAVQLRLISSASS